MKSLLKVGLMLAIVAAVFAGCRSGTVYNVNNSPVEIGGSYTDDNIYKAIKKAGVGLGWIISKTGKGEAKGVLNVRSHQAVVKITYNKKDFSIHYVSSKNLNYNAEKNTIHSNYNGWIQNLERAISVQLSMLEN